MKNFTMLTLLVIWMLLAFSPIYIYKDNWLTILYIVFIMPFTYFKVVDFIAWNFNVEQPKDY